MIRARLFVLAGIGFVAIWAVSSMIHGLENLAQQVAP